MIEIEFLVFNIACISKNLKLSEHKRIHKSETLYNATCNAIYCKSIIMHNISANPNFLMDTT